MTQVRAFLVFAALSMCCAAGVFHASLWAVVVSSSILFLVSAHRPRGVFVSSRSVAEPVALAASALNAAAVSAFTYIGGAVAAWVWGF